jgi:hypothetical protein
LADQLSEVAEIARQATYNRRGDVGTLHGGLGSLPHKISGVVMIHFQDSFPWILFILTIEFDRLKVLQMGFIGVFHTPTVKQFSTVSTGFSTV